MSLLSKQHALITGGSKGIGNAIANKFSSLGCKITILSRDEEFLKNEIDKLNKFYPLKNGELHDYIKFDLSKCNEIEETFKFNKKFKNINILVNCAGVSQAKLHMNIPIQEINDIININLVSPMILSKLFIRNFSRKDRNTSEIDGNIINISSIVSLDDNESTDIIGAGVYASSKAALNRFTQLLAIEQEKIHLRRPKSSLIRVNALLPGHVRETNIGKSVKLEGSAETSSSSSMKTTTVENVAQNAVDCIIHNKSGELICC